MSFQIGNKTVGRGHPAYIIAEIGSNFDGKLTRAKDLISLAKDAGADAAKFQHYTAESLVNQQGFDNLNIETHQTQWRGPASEIYDKASLNIDWTAELHHHCVSCEIDFLTSPYSITLLEAVVDFIPAIKIGSGDITYTSLIERASSLGRPIFLATGASSMEDVSRAVKIIEKSSSLCIMQCNTNYEGNPCHDKYQNINVLKSFMDIWPSHEVGVSCHMKSHTAVLAAVSIGACVVEKHFTDDCSRHGPDHSFALDFSEFSAMVNLVREVEKILGDGEKRVEANERSTYFVQRRSLGLTVDLPEHTTLKSHHLVPLRPYMKGAFGPHEISSLIGRRLSKKLCAGTTILKDHLED